MPTKEEALLYLGIDYSDDTTEANVVRALATAQQLVKGAVGADVFEVMGADSRVKELTLIYMEDLYGQRGLSAKVSGAVRRLVHDLELQLRLELAQAKEVAAG